MTRIYKFKMVLIQLFDPRKSVLAALSTARFGVQSQIGPFFFDAQQGLFRFFHSSQVVLTIEP